MKLQCLINLLLLNVKNKVILHRKDYKQRCGEEKAKI